MIKDVLQSISNIEIYPIIALILFLVSFLAVTLKTLFMNKAELARLSRLPLDENETAGEQPESSGE